MTFEDTFGANRNAILAAREQGNVEELDEIIVGRDVLELVSSAMYIDPMTVYREYIQNAADAVDDARRGGILGADERGRVAIDIDPKSRSIRIRDNGTGISSAEFGRRMTALGASSKRGTNARGFRGVGRLAGLGYAQELIFRSRTVNDNMVAEVSWDCRKLKALLRQEVGNIESLIRSIVTLRRRPGGDYPEHFFEVELRGVVRIRSDKLMSPASVEEYLGQVGPVPFSPEFRFGAQLREALAPVVELGELEIFIDGKEQPVFRPHRDVMVQENGKPITFDRVSIREIPGMDGEPAAVFWILHHEYEGALPASAGIRGLRIRAGNVQIGDNNLLEDLFPESRFNSWSVGEVHIIDRKITPNGRRDHFEQNSHYTNLVNQLNPAAREIAKLCRNSSIKRKWLRDVDLHRQQIEQAIGVIEQGAVSTDRRAKLVSATEETFSRVGRILGNAVFDADDVELQGRAFSELKIRYESLPPVGRPQAAIAELNEGERKAFGRFCDLVYECSPNTAAAKTLIDKIIAKINSE